MGRSDARPMLAVVKLTARLRPLVVMGEQVWQMALAYGGGDMRVWEALWLAAGYVLVANKEEAMRAVPQQRTRMLYAAVREGVELEGAGWGVCEVPGGFGRMGKAGVRAQRLQLQRARGLRRWRLWGQPYRL